MTRRTFLGTAAGASALPLAGGARPNLIFYVADELRAESVGCYGHPLVKTPNIDRLAAQGTRFAQCHVQNTVCEPSRCSFMTGWPVHVRGHRSLYYALHPDEPNLLRYLKESGYNVYWFGKNDLLSLDSFSASVNDAEPGPGGGMFTRNPYAQDDARFYSFLWAPGGDRRKTGDYVNVQSAAEIMARQSDKPFCLFLPLLYPHPPYSAPADFHDMYRPEDVPPLRPASTPRLPRYHQALRRRMRLDRVDESHLRKVQAVYLGQVSYTDWVVGELLEAVERTNHAKDTAVLFFSDHGDYAGDYGLVEKWPNAMHDTLTHIPLLARVPGLAGGHVVDEPVELFDVMATALALAGVEAKHTHFARSLVPQLEGKPGDANRAAFCEGGYNANEPQCFEPLDQFKDKANPYYPKVALQNEEPDTVTRAAMIRTATHKLIYRPDDQSELYDLAADRREVHNVYGDKQYGGVQEGLLLRLLDWYVRTSDAAPKTLDSRGFPAARHFE